MAYDNERVILRSHRPFGGSRIAGGKASVDLWSDGTIIGASWSDQQPEIAGEMFSFRGTVARAYSWEPKPRTWRLEDAAGQYIGTYATRKACLDQVDAIVVMDAFRALNRIEATR